MKVRFAAAVTAFLISSTAGAATLNLSEFPSVIQSCMTSGTCFADDIGSDVAPYTSSFFYIPDTSNPDPYYLLRYRITPPSTRFDGTLYPEGLVGTQTPVSGYMWLAAPLFVSTSTLAPSPNFTMFFDKITSSSGASGGSLSTITTSQNNIYQNSIYDVITHGSIFYSDQYSLPCIGCSPGFGQSLSFNLVNLNYELINNGSMASLSFNPNDPRTQLLSYQENINSVITSYDIYTNTTVPVPGALWLLASGFLGLGALAKKRKVLEHR